MDRREVIAALAAAGLGCLYPGQSVAAVGTSQSGIRIIQPKKRTLPPPGPQRREFEYRLGRAVLELLQDWYGRGNLPVWGRPMDGIDLEKRVVNIVYWVLRSIPEKKDVYPVDPVWVLAQIMEESCFYEFAVSWAFAVGICQFMPSTAQSVGMICPDTSPLPKTAVKRAELASAREKLKELYSKRREAIASDPELFRDPKGKLKDVLQTLAAGDPYPDAVGDLSRLEQLESLNAALSETRSAYRTFLEANFRGRSIFDSRDLDFLTRFDQRVTYEKPIRGMVRIMAENLRARDGNLLAATAAYNSGLSRTYTQRAPYEPYGQIPAYGETVAYVSRIVVNHHEILSRMERG